MSRQGFLSGVEIGGGHQGWWTTAKSLKKAWPHPFVCGVIQKTLAQAGPHSPHKLWGGLSGLSLQKAGKRCPSTPKLGKTGLNGKEMMSQVDGWDRYNTRSRQSDLAKRRPACPSVASAPATSEALLNKKGR